MKKITQAETNPFKYSDSNKRYHTFDYYLRRRFGGKCARAPIDAGFTCPNKDGTKGVGGCIFCSGGSSGAVCPGTIEEQYARAVESVQKKWQCVGYIPYLQANTNTYASAEALEELYLRAARLPGAVILAIATRADCLTPENTALLRRVSEKIPLIVELGLQTVHDSTAEKINRCHTYAEFVQGYSLLRQAGGNISVCIHLINGLPGEDEEMMLETARAVAGLRPHMVKLHLLHVLRGTELSRMYQGGKYTPMTEEAYVNITASQLELLPPETVIARLTGDAPASLLEAPLWCRKKTAVTNNIDKELFNRSTCQGAQFNR